MVIKPLLWSFWRYFTLFILGLTVDEWIDLHLHGVDGQHFRLAEVSVVWSNVILVLLQVFFSVHRVLSVFLEGPVTNVPYFGDVETMAQAS